MPDTGDEADSRIASIGQQRPRSARSSTRSSRDGDSRPAKRRRRNRSRAEDMKDIVPRGASFSATPLEVDPVEGSSSDVKSSSDSEQSDKLEPEKAEPANPHAGSTVPAISWNQGRKSAIRTTLGKRKATDDAAPHLAPPSAPPLAPTSASQPEIKPSKNASSSSSSLPSTTATTTTKPKQFAAVNAYWKPQDESASSEHSEDEEDQSEQDDSSDLEEGEVNSDSDNMNSDPNSPDHESESDSDSVDSDPDDSILLNIGTKSEDGNEDKSHDELTADGPTANGIANGDTNRTPGSSSAHLQRSTETKEQAFQRFAQKYPVAPTVLADLTEEDRKRQVDFWYWFREVAPADYGTLPPGCFECLKRGHLSEVCPDKDCPHCGQWGEHTALWCPVWLRCEKCRERGHSEAECTSSLRSSAGEVPCDICGRTDHVERRCLRRIQLPMYEPDTMTGSNQFRISISCSHCLSNSHILGDCPNRVQTQETAWISLRGISPSRIINTNTERDPEPPRPVNYQEGRGRPQGRRGGFNARSDSSSSDDVLPLRAASNRNPPPRGNPRGRGRGAANPPSSSGSRPWRSPWSGSGTWGTWGIWPRPWKWPRRAGRSWRTPGWSGSWGSSWRASWRASWRWSTRQLAHRGQSPSNDPAMNFFFIFKFIST
ncbi:uncharacterized protein N7483_004387 [Penicillium malachiteum]|uniref:uncharacterized protein n=1 Tax=Penicillium malachiteum TaxID=1324776 RepID=UPI0025477E9F|nr:uncharacterized protein N7483_004387 [Penicillium malachiteum]KAJ5729879.1 hypothetical protein N7483_004387 [Penicillium malachiteum]